MRKFFAVFLFGTFVILAGCATSRPQAPTESGASQVSNSTSAGAQGSHILLHSQNGEEDVALEIADTSPERTKGLMYRTSLAENHGMLFIFDQEAQLSFWMKNTLIPLDMIFFDKNFKVVHIAREVQPCKADPCPTYGSVKPAKYVLEVSGGESDRWSLKEGDTAELTI